MPNDAPEALLDTGYPVDPLAARVMAGPRVSSESDTRPTGVYTPLALVIAGSLALWAYRRLRQQDETKAIRAFAGSLGHGMALADLSARTQVFALPTPPLHVLPEGAQEQAVRALKARLDSVVAAPAAPSIPKPPTIAGLPKPPVFQEALDELKSRVPKVVQPAWQATATSVGQLYLETGSGVIAAVKAADERVARKVQDMLTAQVREGWSIGDTVKALQADTGWAHHYAETVVRTNLTGAQATGRFQAALQSPAVAGMRFIAVDDHVVRDNHIACHDTFAIPQHPLWGRIFPPLGYNCRCGVVPVTWAWAARLGLLDKDGNPRTVWPKPGGGPDQGFVHAGIPASVAA